LRILAVSDLHYDLGYFRGVDESKAWSWLLGIVRRHEPDLLLSAGDWGTAVSPGEFQALLERTTVLTIYGNHDRVDVLSKLANKNGLPVLLRDGRIYEVGGLRVAGINGITSPRGGLKKGVPRKTPGEFLSVASKLSRGGVDILLIHETPYLPELFPFMKDTPGARAALKAIEMIRPRIVINGHMHSGGFRIYSFPFGTKYIYLCSDQIEKHYLLLDSETMTVEVWRDSELAEKLNI
jgi:Icc-related predicted phosphoesterase